MKDRNRNSWIRRNAAKLGAAVLGACMVCTSVGAPWAEQRMMTEVQAEEVSLKDYLLEKWRNRESPIDLEGYQATSDDVGKIVFQMYRYEAEYYFVSRSYEYLTDSDGYITKLYMNYGFDRDAELEAEAAKVLALIDDSMSDLEKALVIHDYLCLDVEYQENYTSSHEVTGPLLEKKAVCEGYAKAYKYYLDRAGIPCRIVTGYSANQPHAWNQIRIDGKWYFVDATWDDADTFGGGVKYDHFLCSGEKLSQDHQFNADSYETCEDKTYEGAFWKDRIAKTPMYAKDGSIYYVYNAGNRFSEYGIYRHDLKSDRLSDRGRMVVSIEEPWEIYTGTSSYEYASFALKDGLLYYSTPKAVYSCGLDGKNPKQILKTEGKDQIWSLKISGGTLLYETAETANGARTTRSHVLDASYQKMKYPISVQSRTVKVPCGEEKYLNSFAPGTITYTSDHPEICTVDAQGILTAVGKGKAKITLQTEETPLYLPGKEEISVEVLPKDISEGYLELSGYSFTYNGKPQEPTVTVQQVPGLTAEDYTVSYQNNVKPGTATVTVTAKGGNYTGVLTASFTIEKGSEPVTEPETQEPESETKEPETETQEPESETQEPESETQEPESETKEPESETQEPESETKEPESETQEPESETKEPESETKEPESETKAPESETQEPESETKAPETEKKPEEKPISVKKPAKVRSVSVKASGKKRVRVQWKSQSCTGYRIEISGKRKFKRLVKTVNVKGKKKKAKVISGLRSGRTYYVRVCAYKKMNGRIFCGAYSQVKKIRVK